LTQPSATELLSKPAASPNGASRQWCVISRRAGAFSAPSSMSVFTVSAKAQKSRRLAAKVLRRTALSAIAASNCVCQWAPKLWASSAVRSRPLLQTAMKILFLSSSSLGTNVLAFFCTPMPCPDVIRGPWLVVTHGRSSTRTVSERVGNGVAFRDQQPKSPLIRL